MSTQGTVQRGGGRLLVKYSRIKELGKDTTASWEVAGQLFFPETVGVFHAEGRSVPESSILSGVCGCVFKERQNRGPFWCRFL